MIKVLDQTSDFVFVKIPLTYKEDFDLFQKYLKTKEKKTKKDLILSKAELKTIEISKKYLESGEFVDLEEILKKYKYER